MSVAAVVVSYNRRELLSECLESLVSQDQSLDEIIVVDNASSDGSPDLVRLHFPNVTLVELHQNLGGAGGFAYGIDIAISKGHQFAWLMDDDAKPFPDALRLLTNTMSSCLPRPGFVAPVVVNQEGVPSTQHQLEVSTNSAHQLLANEVGGIATSSAAFVGVLVDLERAASTHLPYPDFFIWFDDVEYTRRIANESIGIVVPKSRIFHPEKPNRRDMGSRLFFHLRNQIWLRRLDERDGVRESVVDWRLVKFCVTQGLRAENKILWASSVVRAAWQGGFTLPKKVMPGELNAVN
jgi:rhamnopyranosyl-N-acetylglucosaminyl-diphospho-decaprenol beta-1,3/1,4-galactofuranosyltransferase